MTTRQSDETLWARIELNFPNYEDVDYENAPWLDMIKNLEIKNSSERVAKNKREIAMSVNNKIKWNRPVIEKQVSSRLQAVAVAIDNVGNDFAFLKYLETGETSENNHLKILDEAFKYDNIEFKTAFFSSVKDSLFGMTENYKISDWSKDNVVSVKLDVTVPKNEFSTYEISLDWLTGQAKRDGQEINKMLQNKTPEEQDKIISDLQKIAQARIDLTKLNSKYQPIWEWFEWKILPEEYRLLFEYTEWKYVISALENKRVIGRFKKELYTDPKDKQQKFKYVPIGISS